MTTTHYDRVGAPLTATPAEIKRAYRKRVRHAHPDHGGSATQFRLLTDAFEVLTDPVRRAAYDAELERSFRAPQAPTDEQPPPTPRGESPRGTGSPPETSSPPRASAPRPTASAPRLPPRAVLDEPRVPEHPPRAVRRAAILGWAAATLLLAYVAAAYALTVVWAPAPSYAAFALVSWAPLLVGLSTWRLARVPGPLGSSGGWRVVGLLGAAALTAVLVEAARTGEVDGYGAGSVWAFAVATAVVPVVVMVAGAVLRAARARARRALVAERVRWARATERRARAEEWAAMQAAARQAGHGLWWVLDATRDGPRTQVQVTDEQRDRSRTGTVRGACLSHIWIVLDERTDTVVRRCSDDRRQAWVDELATAS